MQARFLVMEGVDGSGKTTQAEGLLAWMRSLGRDPVHLREPGTTQVGERLRSILLDPNRDPCSPRTEALLFFAARGELLRQEVAPALAAGRDVICERFTPSTLAYQGQEPDDREFILALDEIVVGAHQPDLVLLLDLPASRSWQRTRSRAGNAELDAMEARGLDFLEQVRAGYLAYAVARPHQSALLEVDDWDRERVQFALRKQLQERFPKEFAGKIEA
jgi:dTMP kinase